MRGFYRKGGYYGRYNRNTRGGGENKFFDTTQALVTVTTAGIVTTQTVLVIPEGFGESDRIGRKITVNKVLIRLFYKLGAGVSAGAAHDCCRFVVYLDKQANGAAATWLDIFKDASYLSFRNLANTSRFRILYDKITTHNATAAWGNGTTNSTVAKGKCVSIIIPMSIVILYNATAQTGALTTIESNNIGIMAITENAEVEVNYVVRVRYHE